MSGRDCTPQNCGRTGGSKETMTGSDEIRDRPGEPESGGGGRGGGAVGTQTRADDPRLVLSGIFEEEHDVMLKCR